MLWIVHVSIEYQQVSYHQLNGEREHQYSLHYSAILFCSLTRYLYQISWYELSCFDKLAGSLGSLSDYLSHFRFILLQSFYCRFSIAFLHIQRPHVTVSPTWLYSFHLPNTDYSIEHENCENNKRLHKSSCLIVRVFEPS